MPDGDDIGLRDFRAVRGKLVMRLKGAALLLLVAALFLFAPAMQGIGLSAGNADQHPGDPAAAIDRAASAAAADLAARP